MHSQKQKLNVIVQSNEEAMVEIGKPVDTSQKFRKTSLCQIPVFLKIDSSINSCETVY